MGFGTRKFTTGGLELIRHHIVSAAGGDGSIGFLGLPQHYLDLHITITGTSQNGPADIFMRFNEDAGTNYDWQRLSITDVTPSYATGATQAQIIIGSMGGGAPQGSALTVDVPGYSRTDFRKYASIETARWDADSTNGFIMQMGNGRWRSTAGINGVRFINNNLFAAGTVFSIYGVGRSARR